MAKYTVDQKRLLDLHGQLDHATYKVGSDSKGKLLGKAKNGTAPDKISSLDCSGYVKYVLYNASEGKITIKDGSWNQNKWCQDQKLKTGEYSKVAGKLDNILRLGYFKKKKNQKYGHIWLVLNGETLESHGGTGVNRRAWNNSVLLKNVTDCYEVANTTVLSPAKYRLTSKLRDPELRRLLDAAIDNDKRINFFEIFEILLAVVQDGKITMQELKDLQTIFEFSKSLQGPGKDLLAGFIRDAPKFMQDSKQPIPKQKGSQTPTQKADQEFHKRHPELNGRALTGSKADAPLRKEWVALYRQFGGR